VNGDLLAALGRHGEVRAVAGIDEAFETLRARAFDLVVGDPAALGLLAAATSPERGEALLERIGLALCVVACDGSLVWADEKLRAYPEAVAEQIRQACVEICQELNAAGTPVHSRSSRRRTLNIDRRYHLELIASPLLGADQRVAQVITLVSDHSAIQNLQERINAIDSAGRDLVRLDIDAVAEMDVADRLQLLEDKIVQYSHELLRFDHLAVRLLDSATNMLETVIASGFSEEAKDLPIRAEAEGNGISGYVAATGRSYICPDVSQDPRYLPGLHNARSTLTVPLTLQDQVIGIFNVESDQPHAFSEEDRQFAEIFGRYIAMALHIFQLLAAERNVTANQLAADVTAELAKPLNNIVAEVAGMLPQLNDQPELGDRLHRIVDHVDVVKRAIQSVTGATGVRGLIPERPVADPVLAGRRILIAEDEDAIRETIAEVLSKSGALTTMAVDGEEAVSLIRVQHFDLVLSDIKMPYKNGYEVFSAVKQVDVHCPVILITGFGYDPNHSIVRASKEGLASVLFKPFKVDQLLEQARHALTSNVI